LLSLLVLLSLSAKHPIMEAEGIFKCTTGGVEEGEKREAVYELGRALVRSGQARRAAHLLRKHNAHLHDARSLLLAATALLEVKVRATLDSPSRDPPMCETHRAHSTDGP
jgi:hypothetical protein